MTDHAHVSDLRWDRLLANELDDDAKASVVAAAAECTTCNDRLAELTRARDAFVVRPLAVRQARSAWWHMTPVMLAAAAALVLFLLPHNDDLGGNRTKGAGPKLFLSAGPRERLVEVTAGDKIYPHDSLQASYTAERDGYGAVLSRDGHGSANVYVPAAGNMVVLPAGTQRLFPGSTVLDEVTGSEVVIVMWCERAAPLAPLLRELEASGNITQPPGCTHRRIVLDKAPR